MALMASACLTSCNMISGLFSDKDSESESVSYEAGEGSAAESGAIATNTFHADGRVVRTTGTYLRMRLGPSTDFDMLTDNEGNVVYLDKGDSFDCYGEKDGFYRICYNGQFVYVSKQFCEIVGAGSNTSSNGSSNTPPSSSASSSSASASSDWDDVLDEYEEFVDNYIKLLKKAKDGDLSAMTQYVPMMEKAQKLANKLDKAGELTPAQAARYAKINARMAQAAQSLQ